MKKLITLGAALSLLAGTLPAFAAGNVTISVSNDSTLRNTISSSATTGMNTAGGSAAALEVNGGNISDSGGLNNAGNGGNSVLGGSGGLIQSGNASATSDVTNKVNSTKIEVTATPWAVDDIAATIGHSVNLVNSVDALAGTDSNSADGSAAAGSISAGNLNSSGGANTLGNGGNTIDGGSGGAVGSGSATSVSMLVNILNRTIVRVQK